MYTASFDLSNRAPLDFDTDRTARVADAPPSVSGEPGTEVSPPGAESLLAELGLPARTVREILSSSSAQAF